MMLPKPMYAYLSAAALALVTVFTFYVFQDFGPQSVLRRFHMDVARGDWDDAYRITIDNPDRTATRNLITFVDIAIKADASYEIGALKRFHSEVLAFVEYRAPNGQIQPVTLHVRQGPTDWRIDVRETDYNPITGVSY